MSEDEKERREYKGERRGKGVNEGQLRSGRRVRWSMRKVTGIREMFGVTMGSLLSPVLEYLFTKYFEYELLPFIRDPSPTTPPYTRNLCTDDMHVHFSCYPLHVLSPHGFSAPSATVTPSTCIFVL